MQLTTHFTLLLMATLILGGCQRNERGVPKEVADRYRAELLKENPPASPLSVSEVRAQLASSTEPDTPQSVVITGTIGQMPNPFQQGKEHPNFPWVEPTAGFFLVDDATVEEFAKHGHAKGEECSFCLDMAGRRTDRVALIEIRQEDGKPAPYRADTLLGLKEGDHLVIEGTASLIMETMLVVSPKSIHVGPAPQPSTAPGDVVTKQENSSSALAE